MYAKCNAIVSCVRVFPIFHTHTHTHTLTHTSWRRSSATRRERCEIKCAFQNALKNCCRSSATVCVCARSECVCVCVPPEVTGQLRRLPIKTFYALRRLHTHKTSSINSLSRDDSSPMWDTIFSPSKNVNDMSKESSLKNGSLTLRWTAKC